MTLAQTAALPFLFTRKVARSATSAALASVNACDLEELMSSAESSFGFPDTNIYLHYNFFSELDWCKALRVSKVTLVLPSVTLRELDRKKFDSQDPRLRERARNVITRINEIVGQTLEGELRPGVRLLCLPEEPNLEWGVHGLDPNMSDDWFLAHIIEFRRAHNGADVKVITADLGLRLKCVALGLNTIELPTAYRLATSYDPAASRVKELQQEVARLRDRFPRLKLGFWVGDNLETHRSALLRKPEPLAEHQITDQLESERNRCQYVPPETPSSSKILTVAASKLFSAELKNHFRELSRPSTTEVKRYSGQLNGYIAIYRRYLLEMKAYEDFWARTVRIDLTLQSVGAVPAEDIDIFLRFPDGLELKAGDRMPPRPTRPKPPKKPRSLYEQMTSPYVDIDIPALQELLRPQNLYRTERPNLTGPIISTGNGYEVRFHIRRLKHQMKLDLDPLFVMFVTYEESHSFGFDYKIVAGNAPEPFLGELHIVIES